MALPELDVARVQRWCAARVPGHARPPSPRRVPGRPTTTSRSPSGAPPGARTSGRNEPASRSRACATTTAGKSWALYWRDRNLRFHIYDLLAPSNRVDDLLTEIGRDPTCIFWG